MSKVNSNIYLKIFSFIFIFLNLISITNSIYKILDLVYTHSITLLNGNIFIIHKNGVTVYNYNFTIILYNNNFGGIPLISSKEDNDLTAVVQCTENNKYVVSLIRDKIYFFSSKGQYLFHKSNNFFSDFPTEIFYKYFSFLYYKYENSYYYFIISFINSENKIKLIKFQIDFEEQAYNTSYKVYDLINSISDSVSCQIIDFKDNPNILECLNTRKENSFYYMILTLFNPEEDFLIINETKMQFYGNYKNYLIKSTVSQDKKKLYFLFKNPNITTFNWFAFDFDLFKSTSIQNGLTCISESLINLYYSKYSNQFIFSCNSNEGISLFSLNYNSDINIINGMSGPIHFNNCTKIINYDIIFLVYEKKYYLISDFDCGFTHNEVYDFPNHIKINEYVEPSDEPDSFYWFTSSPTIKKFSTTHLKFQTTIIKSTLFNKLTTTIPKIVHKTLITTIAKTFPNTIQKTILTSISKTTNIKTLITTNINIYTTIPNKKSTILLKIPTSIIKNFYNNSQTIITTILTHIQKINNITQITTKITTYSNISIKYSYITSSILKINPYPSSVISEYDCKLKCLECNSDSLILNLCINCNIKKEYYPTLPIFVNGRNYYECYNEETKPSNYYFNRDTKYYEPCYSNCKTCNYKGNDDINNCTLCKNGYRFRPDEINSTNCVIICSYYYYISFGQYFCTENNQCPLIANLLIRNKAQCTNNCNNNKEYKFQFNYECYKECPDGTEANEKNICELKNKKKCYLYSDYFLNVNYKSLESNNFENLIKRYINGFNNTDFHVDFYQSQNYTITIYKTMECLKELEMAATIIDFGDCYQKIKQKYNLTERNLIILISDFFNENKLAYTLFYFFNPDTGEELPLDKICEDESFTIEKSLTYFQNLNIEQAKFFKDQDIDVFNSSDVFYNDLCYYFESPNGKDVPLKERIKLFFPNITFCEEGCNNVGVNLTSMKAICECKLKDLLSETKDASRLVGLDFTGLIESISLDVLKCYKTLFQFKYFIKCYGGFLTIFLIIGQTICVIIAGKVSMFKIRRITFWIIDNYSNLLKSESILNVPPKKKIKIYKSSIFNENLNSQNETKYKLSQKNVKSNLKLQKDNTKLRLFDGKQLNKKMKLKEKINVNKSNINNNRIINLEEYLMTSIDDLDYDEAINRENRDFCRIFLDKLIARQMIVDLFYNNNWILPKSIKFIFFIVRIDLYIVVNALFYNEEYITNLYYSKEKEKFFSFVPRSLNRIIYTSIVSTVLNFIISLLFPTENKIKKIIIRKRNNLKEMERKLLITMKNIINNYWIFIIISYILTIFSWYYISCFNNAYPYLKIEWIKSSIFIIILIQLISIGGCFLFSLLRFISIKCKSEKIFKILNYLFS